MRADSGQAAGRRAETLLSKKKGTVSERRKEKGNDCSGKSKYTKIKEKGVEQK